MGRKIHSVVTLIAAAVALFVALAPPLIYAISDWNARSLRLETLANVSASEVSARLARGGDIWAYAVERALEIAEARLPPGADIRTEVLSLHGDIRLRAPVPPPAWPQLSASGVVREFGTPVGHIRLVGSWREGVHTTGIIFVVCCVVAYMTFFPLRRLPQAALRRVRDDLVISEAALRKAQAIAHIGSWRFEIASGRLIWSEETYRLFDVPPGEPVSYETLISHVHEEDRDKVDRAFHEALRGAPFDIVHRVPRDTGVRWVRQRVEVTNGPDGNPVRVDGTIEDVTLRLDHEEGLRLARDRAEMANRAKTELLSNMSHELRTPLNAVIGLGETMAVEPFGPLGDPRYREYVTRIVDSGERLLMLVEDLLIAADIDLERLVIAEESIDVTALVTGVIGRLSGMAGARGITIETALIDEPPELIADSRHARRVLAALLSNAIKFSHQGGTVRVSTAVNAQGGLEIAVADDGIGMSPDELPAALSPFGRVNTRLDRGQEGAGLGLTLAVGLMSAHGGAINVDSDKGRGSVFKAVFPPNRIHKVAA